MAGLQEYPVSAVLRAENYERAARFYAEVLGLKAATPHETPTTEGQFTAGLGTVVMIYERPGMPAPENTTLGFLVPVSEFDEVISDLRTRGVHFEDYDLPEIGLKTVGGVATLGDGKVAWFKDTEGNIVSIGTM